MFQHFFFVTWCEYCKMVHQCFNHAEYPIIGVCNILPCWSGFWRQGWRWDTYLSTWDMISYKRNTTSIHLQPPKWSLWSARDSKPVARIQESWFNQLLPLIHRMLAHIFVCLLFLLLFHEIPLLIALIPFPLQILSHVPPVSLLRRWRSNKPCRRFPEIWVPQTICLSVFPLIIANFGW